MSAAGRAAFAHQEQVANAASLAKQDILAALTKLARLKCEIQDSLNTVDWQIKRRMDACEELELRIKSAGRWLLLAEENAE